MAPINFEDDFEAIFGSDDFGEPEGTVFYNGVPVDLGHFDDGDVPVSLGEGVDQIVAQPKFSGPVSQFPSLQEDDVMIIRGKQYKVKNWIRDGYDTVEIILEIVPEK